jgi:hypothetical protein
MATKPGCHQPVDKCKIGVPKGRCRVLPEFAESAIPERTCGAEILFGYCIFCMTTVRVEPR